jgi:hypothetical protein
MSRNREGAGIEGVFAALLGGLIASFVAAAVFWALLEGPGAEGADSALAASLIGLACAVAFMVGGLYAVDRLRWMGTALVFASGFTTLWSVAVSFGAQQKWAVLLALAIAIVIGITVGSRRFRVDRTEAAAARDGLAAL